MSVTNWKIAGSYEVRQPEEDSALEALTADEDRHVSRPLLVYDTPQNASDGLSKVNLPKYLATKVEVPAPSRRTQRVAVLAPSQITFSQMTHAGCIRDIDVPQIVAPENRPKKHASQKSIYLGTTLPAPSQFSYIVLILMLLADVATVTATFATNITESRFIGGVCVLVLVPDIASLLLIFKRNMYTATLCLHLLIWPLVFLVFIQIFTSTVLLLHFLFVALMVLFILQIRKGFSTTFLIIS